MAMPRTRSGRTTSLRESDSRLSESERIEGAGSWDAIEWTKVDPVSRSVPQGLQQFLLEAEQVIVESDGSRSVIGLGTIPLATIEKFSKTCEQLEALLDKSTRDDHQWKSLFRRAVYDALIRWTRPARLWDLYAFAVGPSRFSNSNPRVRLLDEYFRLLGLGSHHASSGTIEDGSFTLSNEWWRISSKLYIADARPRKNALANGAMGGGSESSANYLQSEIVFFGIDNIHAMRESLVRLRDYVDTHGANSSDGMSSFLRHGGWTWGGGNLSSMSASVSTLGDSGWLIHVQSVLAGSAWIAARVALESATVLALVEKDWLAFGHPFSDRLGVPTVSGSDSLPGEFARQYSTGASLRHQCANHLAHLSLHLRTLKIITHRFFCSEKERQQAGVYDACGCLWMYLADLRASDGKSHVHYSHFYDPSKFQGPLLPPAAALAPTLWPQFHLRWACPSEAQAGEIEAHCRNMAKKISELQKAKELAEAKAKETTATMESLTDELRNEKLSSSLARDFARRANKETTAIKRAVQSLGCKVHFSEDGDCIVSIENNTTEIPQKSLFPVSGMQSGSYLQHDEQSDNSVCTAHMADDDSSCPINRVCESLCPLRTRDGGCRWPDAGCAQFGSQFVGLKANFDAFDRLSIYDSYFESQ
ncbi:hypothetical protein DH2020_021515 [Rehmannia glutinosa]|uniref:Myotubularin phosphatase domain-containing protein n=1 Tax=Rehmannia glutinosa TaxID=99300 RepID=A0ABR0WC42_REHGL